jgi:hypothetical protein
MSQKTKKIKKSENMKEQPDYIGVIFNLAQFKMLSYPEYPSENDFNGPRKEEEDKTYQNIVSGLKSDLKSLGVDITYTTRIIIGEIAMNLLFLQRVKSSLICKNLLVEKRILKLTGSSSQKNANYSEKKTSSTSKSYDYYPTNNDSVHPMFEKLVPQLQKQINNGLKMLGLLPVQQLERKKMVVIQKLRQKYEQLDREYIIKAEKEMR